MKQAGTD